MSLQDKPVVLLPPYATTSIYTVVKEYEHKGTAKVRLRHPTSGSEHSKIASEIRIASDEEQACGHRIDPHKVFEEWFKFQPFYAKLVYIHGDRIFDFDMSEQTYHCLPVNIAWITWQEKETKLKSLNLYFKNMHLKFLNMELDYKDELKQKLDLQKRVDAVQKLIREWKEWVKNNQSHNACVYTEESITELEQALKGGAQ